MRHFKIEEFDCSETGENAMENSFLEKLDELRTITGWPFVITSGYRAKTHNREVIKRNGPGTHTQGIACDISVTSGARRYQLVANALEAGFTGIGVGKTFVHLDTRDTTPVIWTY